MTRPNILLITTDQQRTDTLGCYGASWMRTPHLDRLASEGIRFDRAYCTSPLCTPSRISLFTGQYPSRHGAWNIGCNARDDGAFISHSLAENGYRTHHIGKAHWQANLATSAESVEALESNARFPDWTGPYYGFQTAELSIGHNGYNLRAGHHAEFVRAAAAGRVDFGWHPRSKRAFGGEAIDWDLPLSLHASVWTADRACAFLADHSSGGSSQPFFLHLGFQDPHHPHALPRDFADRVNPASVPLPAFAPGELDECPSHYLAAHEGRLAAHPCRGKYPMAGQGEGADYRNLLESDIREARAYYYSMVQLIDAQVGRVLDELEKSGASSNTIVVFTSDHGELLGDHGLWLKGCFPYEEVIRVPLMIRWPRRLRGGTHTHDLISLADIAPTLLSASACRQDHIPRDGVDWLAALQNPDSAPPRASVVIEHVDDPDGLRFRTFVSATEKLTLWEGAETRAEWKSFTDTGTSVRDEELARLAESFAAAPSLAIRRLAYS